MLFHEIYGCYYNAVASILSAAVRGTLTPEAMARIAAEKAFTESALTILPALKQGRWQLLEPSLHTPLHHIPSMPLTDLQLRWLKAISLDPRIRLFRVDLDFLCGVKPLFTPDDFVVFDQYEDGDPYEDDKYIENFHTILDAIHSHRKIRVQYISRRGKRCMLCCSPRELEYSEKDDKFRLLVSDCRDADIINVGRIELCELLPESASGEEVHRRRMEFLVLELLDERNALERVMLHFAHFQKESQRTVENRYRVTIHYDRDDETELVIRVLSFGPLVKVVEPAPFVQLIKERLIMQKSCALK